MVGPPGAGRSRWVVALGAVALVTALTAAIVYALVGRSPDATVLGYVPSGAVVYGEVRLDLPGDQRQAVGQFLSRFPGFADQASLDTKLDEVLDRLTSDASNGKQTYTTNIKPWFDGELAFSVGPLPDPKSMMSNPTSGMESGRALALLSVKDEALAKAWFEDAFKQAGATTTNETYAGVELTIFSSASDGPKAAFAILDGKVAVAGDVNSVKAAVDTKGNGGFAAEPDAKKALGGPDRGSRRVRLHRARFAHGLVAATDCGLRRAVRRRRRQRHARHDVLRGHRQAHPEVGGLLAARRR